MALGAADYRQLFLSLLPTGPAWPRDGSQCYRLGDGLSLELARLDVRADALVEESDPRTTTELLADWERVAGTPGLCEEANPALTLAQRRALLLSKLTATGGQSIQYFVDLAAGLGYSITINEFAPWRCGMSCAEPIYGEAWAYAWEVVGPTAVVRLWRCGDPCGEPLAVYETSLIQCVFQALKPAHTTVIFEFIEETP